MEGTPKYRRAKSALHFRCCTHRQGWLLIICGRRIILTNLIIFLTKSAFLMLGGDGLSGWHRRTGFSERLGGHFHQPFERAGEVILIGVPAGEGNFAHGLVVFMQELPGLGNTK
jgi:hypothetical protein